MVGPSRSRFWSLRARIVALVLAVVVPAAVAHAVSHTIDGGIQERVADLRRERLRPLDEAGVVGASLELKGVWDDAGFFAVEGIEELARQRRPKLRGPIQAVAARDRFVMFGVAIRLVPETELPPVLGAADGAWSPQVGARVEVSCTVDEAGEWYARKVRHDELKPSDKIKGTVTRAERRAGGGLRIEISGLPAVTPAGVQVVVLRGPMHRMELASRMARTLQECLAATQELLRLGYMGRALPARTGDRVQVALLDAEDRLLDASAEFADLLADARRGLEDADAPRDSESDGMRARLGPAIAQLQSAEAPFGDAVQRVIHLVRENPDAAQAWVVETLEPTVRRELQPRVQALQVAAEEELSEELAAIGARSAWATRMSLLSGLAGLVLALTVGWFAARTVSRPVVELEAAARRIGAGELDARVGVRSNDELGALANAFNHMAEHLAASTVSVARLNGVIDSLAGAFFLLGPDGTIASMNPAAMALLGYAAGELDAAPFATICAGDAGELMQSMRTSDVTSGEQLLRRRDGSAVPVAFSGAVLRGEVGTARGFVCLASDLSERKRMEEALRRSLGEKELLLRDLHHRVKNNLQVISSLLDLQAREVVDPQALAKFRNCQDRIRSLVLIHEQLYRAGDVGSVDMRTYLGLLASHLAQAHVEPNGRVQVAVEVDAVRLDFDRALACGLIVNELVTNAVKHAFPAGAGGTVMVRVALLGTRLRLQVSDDGRGASAAARDSERLGMQLVHALCRQIGGALVVNPAGDAARRGHDCHVDFPFTPSAEAT